MAVDTLGHILALHVTPASADDRSQVGRLAEAMKAATDESVEIAFVDQGYTGERPAKAAAGKASNFGSGETARGQARLVLLPRRWVVERSATMGLPASGGSSRLRAICHKPWQTCTSSHSSASCSKRQLICHEVHNSL